MGWCQCTVCYKNNEYIKQELYFINKYSLITWSAFCNLFNENHFFHNLDNLKIKLKRSNDEIEEWEPMTNEFIDIKHPIRFPVTNQKEDKNIRLDSLCELNNLNKEEILSVLENIGIFDNKLVIE